MIQGSTGLSQAGHIKFGGIVCRVLFSGMIVVGLTGGLATGKSTIAKLFQKCGAAIIDADILARQVVEPGKPAWRDIVREFGHGMLHADRTLNRHALAAIVFRYPRKLQILNRIVHPRVAREQARLIREFAAKTPGAVVIYDAPLLIEANAHTRMDKIIVTSTDRRTQITRLQARNHMSRSEALRRIRTQIPLREKVQLADYIIDGRLLIEELRMVVKKIFLELNELAMQAAQKGSITPARPKASFHPPTQARQDAPFPRQCRKEFEHRSVHSEVREE